MNKSSYFSEREYIGVKRNYNSKLLDYWNEILNEESVELLNTAYGVSLDEILFQEYNEKDYSKAIRLEKLIAKFFSGETDEPLLYNIGEGKKLVFDKFVYHCAVCGKKVLEEKVSNTENIKAIRECFLKNLSERITKISISTLIFEMYLIKEQGELTGETAKEEYEDYNNRFLGNINYIRELFEIYPCLERMVMETIDNLSNNYALLLHRLNSDYKKIKEKFDLGENLGKIKDIESSGSDSHKKGSSVIIVCWDNGEKLVYKPHCLKTETAFQNFQEYISSHCRLHMKEFHILDCGCYGWEEFVDYKECQTISEVKNYYYRIGVLIFCNYILNVNDIHTENLIVMGEYPVIIDSETIMDNKRTKGKKSAREKVNDDIYDSVLYSGLLPFYKYTQNGKGINMSAINGKEGDEYPILVPILKETGLSTMHYEYVHPISRRSNNLVTLNGKPEKPEKYIDMVSAGFYDAYSYVLKNYNDVLNYIKIFENLGVRHLVQDTQRYSMLLHTSYNPDFLQDGMNRQLFLCSILKNVKEIQGSIEVAKMEIKDLLNMDVPYFSCNTSNSNLYGSEGEEIADYFAFSSIQHLRDKLAGLSQEDLEKQIRFIRIALTDLNDLKVKKQKRDMAPILNYKMLVNSNNVKLEAVLKLYRILQSNAYYGDDNEDINWMGVIPIGEKGNSSWRIHPLGVYLYDGIGGIAVFYNALYKCCPNLQLKGICEAFDKTLFQYTEDMLGRTEGLDLENSGAFAGEASVVYVYEVLYKITNEMKYLKYAEKHADILKHSIGNDKNNDIIYGNAGAIIVLVNLYHLTKRRMYLEWADIAGENVIRNQHQEGWYSREGEVLSGFSHGISGIIFALSILNRECKKSLYTQAIQKGLLIEAKMYVEKYNNWMDNRKEVQRQSDEISKFMAAWCHGAPGILLARSKMRYLLKDFDEMTYQISQDTENALSGIRLYGFSDNDCICHGNLGNTEILLEYAKEYKDTETKQKYMKARTKIAQDILNDDYDCARTYLHGYKIPGFMTGISGMGYSLLRDIYPELPCILALEI